MLTVNIYLQDRLVDGQLRTVKQISRESANCVIKVTVRFDDNNVVLKRIKLITLGANRKNGRR